MMKQTELITLLLVLLFISPIAGQTTMEKLQDYRNSLVRISEADLATLPREVLAKATTDECYFGIGNPDNQYVPTGIDPGICEGAGGQAKTNQAYVWGLAKNGNNLWFGTAPNVHCLVIGSYLGMTGSMETGSYACEFGDSQFSPPFPDALGDWRPSRMYVYDTQHETLEDVTPNDHRLNQVIGIRSVGTIGNIVFLGGPSAAAGGDIGVTLFAFNAQTKAYLGAHTFNEYNNIRKWIVADDVLYTAVGDAEGGHVLRWTGNMGDPFQFEEVGNLSGAGAELAVHEGRLFVTTWPSGLEGGGVPTGVASLFMGPELTPGGLTSADAGNWTAVWKATDYDPDPVTSATYGGGALASYGGYLFWGTMHVPFVSTAGHFQVFGIPDDLIDFAAALLGTYRAISIFRGKNFDTTPEIDLAYGQRYLPKYDPVEGWDIVPNNMGGKAPLFGPSGFGNPFNNYTWTMQVFNNQLYVGTMDYSYLLFGDFNPSMPFRCDPTYTDEQCAMYKDKYLEFERFFDPNDFLGADLLRFSDPESPAVPESITGLGNITSYGIRTMIAEDRLYLGMANPMNLVGPSDRNLGGGWELIALGKKPQAIPTLSEWGTLLMLLLVFSLGLVTILKTTFGPQLVGVTGLNQRLGFFPLDPGLFRDVLLSVAKWGGLPALVLIYLVWREVTLLDLFCITLALALISYNVHLMKVLKAAQTLQQGVK